MAPTTRTRATSFGRHSSASLPMFTSPLGPAHLMPPPQQGAMLSRRGTNSSSSPRPSGTFGDLEDRFLGSLYGGMTNLDLCTDRPVSGDVDDHKVPKFKRAIENLRRSTHSSHKQPSADPACARGDHPIPLRNLQPNAPSPTPTSSNVPGVRYSLARLPSPAYSHQDAAPPTTTSRTTQNRPGSRQPLASQDYDEDDYEDRHHMGGGGGGRGRRASVDAGRSKEADLYFALGLQQAEQERRKRETAKARKSFLSYSAPGAVREYWAN